MAISVRIWLLVTVIMIYLMVVVGGVTRLTGSGLSMVTWEPIAGILPPLSQVEWNGVFELYKGTPQFREQNSLMTVEEFKGIFFWEYLHRVMGRIVGIVFALPLIWFAWRSQLRGKLLSYSLLALFLGGLQGLLGWYMVQSGLVDIPRVSHYRLAAHLSLALILLNLIAILLLLTLPGFRKWSSQLPAAKLVKPSCLLSVLIAIQVVVGALTAGLDAGGIYNTFPSMNGYILAPGALALKPLLLNFIENPVMVQFLHRILGLLILGTSFYFCWRTLAVAKNSLLSRLVFGLLGLVGLQVLLGVLTLLSQVQIELAVWHQLLGTLVLMSSILMSFALIYARRSIEK